MKHRYTVQEHDAPPIEQDKSSRQPATARLTGSEGSFTWGLLVLAVLAPALLFAWVALKERRDALAEAQHTAQRTVRAMQEHALKVLETDELLIGEIDRAIAGRSWDQIERDPGLRNRLAELPREVDHVAVVNVSDASGRIRASSLPSAVGVSVSDREYFAWHRNGHTGSFVSKMYRGRTTGKDQFSISRRRSDEAGAFNGVIAIAVSLDYFYDFWKEFAPTLAYVVPMMRDDGELLARYPATGNPERLDPEGPYMQHVHSSPAGIYTAVSRVDGIERINAYTRIGRYPLYISFSIETRAVFRRWREDMMVYAAFWAMSTLALVWASVLLVRHMRREHAETERWQELAARLQAEIQRREAAEATLRQSQKMEALGQITGGVAHDFNNVLQAITTSLQLARRLADHAGLASLIQAATSAVERGSKLTRHLLAFARRQPLARRPVDVKALIIGMEQLLRATMGSNLQVKIDVAGDIWPAMTDPNQAEMALLNLAVNARDAMPEGGILAIRAVNVAIAAGMSEAALLRPGEYVLICVADTGCGMSEEVAGRALEPFFTTKEPGKGTGLGLSQVHGFVAQCGGGVSIDTAPGRGTRVSLYLPRAEARLPVEAPAANEDAGAAGERRLLLVDDEESIRRSIAAALEAEGYTVAQAGSATEALDALCRDKTINVLVTDLAMSGMRGTELARRARSLRPEIRVLVVTAHLEQLERSTERWSGPVLAKPFKIEELIAVLRRLPAGN